MKLKRFAGGRPLLLIQTKKRENSLRNALMTALFHRCMLGADRSLFKKKQNGKLKKITRIIGKAWRFNC